MTTPLSLYFQREGQPAAPSLVILHGLFGSTPNFTSLAKALAPQFDVIRIDLRNHGRSPHAEHMRYDLMAADVAASLSAIGVSSAIVLGHSMGGKVAMQLAADYPHMVARLIVADIAPKAYPSNSHSVVLSAMSSVTLADVADRKAADAQLQMYIDEPMLRQFLLSNLVRAERGFQWRINLAAIIVNYDQIAAAPQLRGALEVPSLFLRGANSDYIVGEDYATIDQHFSNNQVQTIAAAGHWLHAEQPAAFLAAITEFLAH